MPTSTPDEPVYRFAMCAGCGTVFDLQDRLPAPTPAAIEVGPAVKGQLCAKCQAEHDLWP